MSELRNEVLQAEVVIRQLAEELAKRKGVNEQVEIVEQRLSKAASALEQSFKALEGAQEELTRTAMQVQSTLSSVSEENRKALEEARKLVQEAMVQAQDSLKSAQELLCQVSDQLSQNSQALSSNVGQAVKDLGEQVREALQQVYQNMQEQLTTAVRKAQEALDDAAHKLTALRTGFERDLKTLTQQNQQISQRIDQQDAKVERVSKWIKFCLIFACLATLISILLLIRSGI